jgi:hypothetical protein
MQREERDVGTDKKRKKCNSKKTEYARPNSSSSNCKASKLLKNAPNKNMVKMRDVIGIVLL